jgi:hypothetical protein
LEALEIVLRPDFLSYYQASGHHSDMIIVRVKNDGTVKSAVNYNFQGAGISFKIAMNSLTFINKKLVFGGFTKGFTTRMN